jgi:hypothetical protein
LFIPKGNSHILHLPTMIAADDVGKVIHIANWSWQGGKAASRRQKKEYYDQEPVLKGFLHPHHPLGTSRMQLSFHRDYIR